MSKRYVVVSKGIIKPSMTSTTPMGKAETCKLLNNLERQLEEARELLVKSNSQLDLTWYAIGCTVDDHAIKRLKSIYHRELDKLKEKGDE